MRELFKKNFACGVLFPPFFWTFLPLDNLGDIMSPHFSKRKEALGSHLLLLFISCMHVISLIVMHYWRTFRCIFKVDRWFIWVKEIFDVYVCKKWCPFLLYTLLTFIFIVIFNYNLIFQTVITAKDKTLWQRMKRYLW